MRIQLQRFPAISAFSIKQCLVKKFLRVSFLKSHGPFVNNPSAHTPMQENKVEIHVRAVLSAVLIRAL